MMNRPTQALAEAQTAWKTFLRRRTAVVFTFVFPVLLVLVFGALVSTEPGDGGLFVEDAGYYLAGYLAVVVLFTPLSRLSVVVIRHRDANRFEKLATTPMTRAEWLLAHTMVTAILVLIASILIVLVLGTTTEAPFPRSPVIAVFILAGVVAFSGMGAVIGRLASTQDGAIAVSNTIAIPMVFLADTFVSPAMLPEWFGPVVSVLPLTPFSRGVRALTTGSGSWGLELIVLGTFALLCFVIGVWALPRTE